MIILLFIYTGEEGTNTCRVYFAVHLFAFTFMGNSCYHFYTISFARARMYAKDVVGVQQFSRFYSWLQSLCIPSHGNVHIVLFHP